MSIKRKQVKESLLEIKTMRESASDETLEIFEALVREEEEIQEKLDILKLLLRKKDWKLIRDWIEQWESEFS